jgi:hypothetical protein
MGKQERCYQRKRQKNYGSLPYAVFPNLSYSLLVENNLPPSERENTFHMHTEKHAQLGIFCMFQSVSNNLQLSPCFYERFVVMNRK